MGGVVRPLELLGRRLPPFRIAAEGAEDRLEPLRPLGVVTRRMEPCELGMAQDVDGASIVCSRPARPANCW